MKKVRLILLLALLFKLTVADATVSSQSGETRTAKVTKKINANATINVRAKYTDLVIESWDKNEVYIEATVRFDGKMTRKMEDFLASFQQEVESGIESSISELRINTNLDEPNKVQIGSKNIGIIMGFSADDLKISYYIKAPKSNLLEIDHSYEDLNILSHFESLNLTQYSGDLTGKRLERANLNLKYGSAKLESIGSGEITIYEQELQVNEIGKIDLNAKYSDLEFERVKFITVEAYESDFELGSVTTLEGNLKYGDMNFREKLTEGKLELYEMDLEGSEITQMLLTNSKYSKFDFETVQSIQFDQSYEDEVKIGTLGKLSSANSKYANFEIERLIESFIIDAYEVDINLRDIDQKVSQISLTGKYLKGRFSNLPANYSILANTKYGKIKYDENKVNVKRYIKESDKLELEAFSKSAGPNPTVIKLSGYELTIDLE